MEKRTDAPSAKFWDRIAKRYARSPVADQTSYERKLAMTREHFTEDSVVLEFGCGTGSTAIAHAPFVKQIVASDISGKMLEIARERAAAAGADNVRFEQATIESLTAADASQDVVLGLNILHLIADREAAIAKVWRMLKPGGVFISSTVCLADSHGYLRPVLAIGRVLGLVPYVKFLGRSELEAELTDAGFAIETSWQPARGKGVFIIARKP